MTEIRPLTDLRPGLINKIVSPPASSGGEAPNGWRQFVPAALIVTRYHRPAAADFSATGNGIAARYGRVDAFQLALPRWHGYDAGHGGD